MRQNDHNPGQGRTRNCIRRGQNQEETSGQRGGSTIFVVTCAIPSHESKGGGMCREAGDSEGTTKRARVPGEENAKNLAMLTGKEVRTHQSRGGKKRGSNRVDGTRRRAKPRGSQRKGGTKEREGRNYCMSNKYQSGGDAS